MDKMTKKAKKTERDLYIVGMINDEMAMEIVAQLDAIKKEDLEIYQENLLRNKENQIQYDPINITINSPGGYVYSGCAIINALEESIAPIYMHGLGCIASMGVHIYACGDVRTAGDLTTFATHGFGGHVSGYHEEMRASLNYDKKLEEKLDAKLIESTKLTKEDMEHCKTCLDFFDYEQALEKGLITVDIYDEEAMLNLVNGLDEEKSELKEETDKKED